MNSVQLAQRLGRNLAVNDPFNLPADAALDVLAAINGGLQTFYRNMPGQYKRTTLSYTLHAPAAKTIVFQQKYSNLTDSTFDSTNFGCTLRFTDGSRETEIIGPNAILDDYLGDTLSVDGTIYSDVVPIQDVIERVIGAVRVYDNTTAEPTALVRDERLRGGRARRWSYWGEWDEIYYPFDSGWLTGIGRPRYYYLDPAAASQGPQPSFLLRVAPMPDIDYTVRMEAELSTQRILMADLTVARSILVSETYIDDIFIPLCEAELVTSPFWRDPNQLAAVKGRQQDILMTKMPKIPRDTAPSSNAVGRPRGF